MLIRRPASSPDHCRVADLRRAFTMIEILMVIVIIAILISLLLPAIWSVQISAREATITAEIANLENSLADFKSRFGNFPPSQIALYEAGAPGPTGAWDTRSATNIRRLWPQFNFNIARDIDGDGTLGETFVLTGAECLVFFLGGLTSGSEDINQNGVLDAGEDLNGNARLELGAKIGFSPNPANPFQFPSSSSTSRVGPFHEFKPSQLVDVDGTDEMLEYCDPSTNATTPIIYVSSYGGRGYDTVDLSNLGLVDDLDVFGANDPRNMLSVYLATATTAHKPNSYQLISPGLDKTYGWGGVYQAGKILIPPALTKSPRTKDEIDNITNFSGGRLN